MSGRNQTYIACWTTFFSHLTLLKVGVQTSFTECMQTFGDGVGVSKVTITQRTQQMCVEILDIHCFHAHFEAVAC